MATGAGITAAPLHIDLHEGLVVLPAATEHLVRVKVVAVGQAHVGAGPIHPINKVLAANITSIYSGIAAAT